VNANVTKELTALSLRLERRKEVEEGLLLNIAKDDYTIGKLECAAQMQDRRHAEEVQRNVDVTCDCEAAFGRGSRISFCLWV
jgi:hypothetical protein